MVALSVKSMRLNNIQLALFSVYIVTAVDMFGTSLVIPVMALYSEYLGASQSLVGTLYTVYSGASLLSSLYIGIIADKFGRRNVFFYACCGALGGFLGSAVATTFVELVVWRGIAGLFTGTVGTAFAYVSDIVPANVRAVYFSYLSAVMSTCLVIGPLIGGGLAIFSIRAPFFGAAGMAFCELLMIYFFIKEPKDLLNKKVDTDAENDSAVEYDKLITESSGEDKINTKLLKNANDSSNAESNVKKDWSLSPWLNFSAISIGGMGSFLNSLTFTGIAVLVPLELLSSSFGIVKSGDSTTSNSQKISLILGYLLGLFGLIQAVGMIYVFPYLNKKCGLLWTGAIGAMCIGVSFCFLYIANSVTDLVPIYIGMAFGNSLVRPVFPAYLGSLAPKGMNAEYIAINNTFVNLGMMIGGQLTQLYSYNPEFTIILTGFFSILNSIMLTGWALRDQFKQKMIVEEQISLKPKSKLEEFFGEGLPEQEFWSDIELSLKDAIQKRHFTKAVTFNKGQILIKELLLNALPELPEVFDERMEKVYELYLQLGHEEWADTMSQIVSSLHHHRHTELAVPGAS
eukprot:gene9954-13387_t